MLINPYKQEYHKRIDKWYQDLVKVSYIIEEWSTFQKNWHYLHPIFESDDISKELPAEKRSFDGLSKSWKYIMDSTKGSRWVLKICNEGDLHDKFKGYNKQLDLIQMKLNDYLEKKRTCFGRFYFLSDDDLLKILSQTKDVQKIQEHLPKVFENVARLDFDKKSKITGMFSSELERVNFLESIDPSQHGGKVE